MGPGRQANLKKRPGEASLHSVAWLAGWLALLQGPRQRQGLQPGQRQAGSHTVLKARKTRIGTPALLLMTHKPRRLCQFSGASVCSSAEWEQALLNLFRSLKD